MDGAIQQAAHWDRQWNGLLSGFEAAMRLGREQAFQRLVHPRLDR